MYIFIFIYIVTPLFQLIGKQRVKYIVIRRMAFFRCGVCST